MLAVIRWIRMKRYTIFIEEVKSTVESQVREVAQTPSPYCLPGLRGTTFNYPQVQDFYLI